MKGTFPNEVTAPYIVKFMAEYDMSPFLLEQHAGVGEGTVSAIVNGTSQKASLNTVDKLFTYMGLTHILMTDLADFYFVSDEEIEARKTRKRELDRAFRARRRQQAAIAAS